MDYASLQKTADRLISSNGQLVKLCVRTVNYTTAAYSEVQSTCYAVEGSFSHEERNGTSVQVGDRKLYLSALTSAGAVLTVPNTDHFILIGTDYYKVVSVLNTSPGGLNLIYEVRIRG